MIQEKNVKSGKRYRAKVYSKGVKKNIYGSWHKVKKHAQIDETELKHDLQKGSYLKETTLTVNEAMDAYFELVAPEILQQETIELEKGAYKNHIKDYLGHRHLISVQPYEIQKLWNIKKNDLANSSIIKLHNLLNKVYKQYIKWNEIKENPLDGVHKPSPNYSPPKTWTKEEAQSFLEYAKNYQAYILFWIALNTGMRKSEIMGLTWENVDFTRNSIFVRQQYHEPTKKIIYRGKTANSIREISMTLSQMQVLKNHKENQNPKTNIVCSNELGGYLMSRNIRRSKKAICKQANIEEITLHEFRHTHGSMLADMNEPTKYIQERLGHKDATTTLNFYIHTQKSHHQKTAERFDNYFTN